MFAERAPASGRPAAMVAPHKSGAVWRHQAFSPEENNHNRRQLHADRARSGSFAGDLARLLGGEADFWPAAARGIGGCRIRLVEQSGPAWNGARGRAKPLARQLIGADQLPSLFS